MGLEHLAVPAYRDAYGINLGGSLSRTFEQALDLMAAAVRDNPDELSEKGMWQVPAPGADYQFLGPDWNPITDAGQRR